MIELIVLDVDGTMTDGSIIYTQEGSEIKTFNVKDGLGIALWHKLGKKTAIITGRESTILTQRAKELNITILKQGARDKAKILKEVLQELGLKVNQVAIIGDDLNDLPMLREVKYSFAPKDCAKEVKKMVYKVLKAKGGKGAVREMIDFLIQKEQLSARVNEIFS
ncbi:MAG: HAD-IIIA family hydrolase [Helicobacter sp.]|nr:HAD-IIIA family hydrolase [Helicobacter sp.]